MTYDVVIVGGGPAGLAAALTLGRARRRVLLCDAGPRRNAAAVHIHNFVTRDGVTPAEFRRIGREQLAAYPNVEIRDESVEEVRGALGAFTARLSTSGERVNARFVLLCAGMIDELPDIDGLRELWGTSVFICPYCHAWEIRDRRFAFLALTAADVLEFSLLLRGWTRSVTVLTDGRFTIAEDQLTSLAAAGVRVEERRVARLVPSAGADALEGIEFADGPPLACDALFVRPPQRPIPLAAALGLALDNAGRVKTDPATFATSLPGIYAAGDLVTPGQGALIAAASGTMTAAMLNRSLASELALQGALA